MLAAVDVGNTAIKFGAFEGTRLVAVERVDARRSLAEDVIPPALFLDADVAVVLSSSPARTAQFTAWSPRATRVLGDEVRRALRTTYARVEELGLDRVAALVGARELAGVAAVVVASVGTAVTVDAFALDGRLVAGAIAPGLRSAAEGLHAAAPHLPFPSIAPGEVRVPTTGTDEALRAGHVLGLAGLVDRLLADVAAAAGEVGAVIVTGGDAPALSGHLRTKHRLEPHATLHGIRVLHGLVPQ
jgi:type III pantothenate kinase